MNDEHPIGEHTAMLAQLRHDVSDHAARILAIEKVSAAREEQVRALFSTVGEIKQICADIRSEVAGMVEKTQKEFIEAMEKLSARITALERRDGDKWKQFGGYVLSAIVGVVIALVLQAIRSHV